MQTVLAIVVLAVAVSAQGAFNDPDYHNHHYVTGTEINHKNAGTLEPKWTQTYAAISLAPPGFSKDGRVVYTSDKSGAIYARDASSGALIWQTSTRAVDGLNMTFSYTRTRPLIVRDTLIYGVNTVESNLLTSSKSNSVIFALRASDGSFIRKSAPLDAHLASVITGTGRYHEKSDQVIFGTSSNEETFAYLDAYGPKCCSFRGSLSALNAKTLAINWKTYTTGTQPGALPGTYLTPGAAIWASDMPIDEEENAVYVATGNNYEVAPALVTCLKDVADTCASTNGSCIASGNDACYAAYDPKENLAESAIAFDLTNGRIKWSTKLTEEQGWTLACFRGTGVNTCPVAPGKDSDFGQSPILSLDNGRKVISFLQKSGIAYLLDRKTGAVSRAHSLTPGGLTGGFQFGSAYHGGKIYALGTNSLFAPSVMTNGQTIRYGSYLAFDAVTGALDYQLPEPNLVAHPKVPGGANYTFSRPMSQTVVTNDLFGFTSNSGWAYLVNRHTGAPVWQANVNGSSIMTGVAIRRECIYVSTGYIYLNADPTAQPRITAYCLPDDQEL